MSLLDYDELMAPLGDEQPCGEDLTFDDAFFALEKAAEGTPERVMGDSKIPAEEPNWGEVQKQAQALLERTKDVRVAVYLGRALLQRNGFGGFRDAVVLIRQYLETYWDTVHPQLEDGDALMRSNAVSALSDNGEVLKELRAIPLVDARGMGRYDFRDIQIAQGVLSPSQKDREEDEDPPSLDIIEATFRAESLEELQARAHAIEETIVAMDGIDAVCSERIEDAATRPSLNDVIKLLRDMHRVLAEQLTARGVGEQAEADGEAGDEEQSVTQAANRTGGAIDAINSREDAIRVLDKVCEYFYRNEPSSPVPILLQRAKRLVSKNFMEILRDLAPDGVHQAQTISGSDSES